MNDNYYLLLGLAPDATAVEIKNAAQYQMAELKAAYTRLSQHSAGTGANQDYQLLGISAHANPDALQAAAQRQIAAIKEAYSLLSDPLRRQAYDRQLQTAAPASAAQPQAGPVPLQQKPAPALKTKPTPPDHDPYAAPQTDMADFEVPDLVLATRLRRLAAVLLDGLIYLLALTPLLFVAFQGGLFAAAMEDTAEGAAEGAAEGGIEGAVEGASLPMEAFGSLMLGIMALLILGLLIVNLVLLYRNGQTIGKRLLSIKIVRTDGTRCGLRRIFFLRWLPVGLLGAIPVVGAFISLADALLIFQQSRKCLHDLFADTIVVEVA